MKVLVFTSKWIGLNLLDTLFSKFNDDEYLFIVSEPDSETIIESIKIHGHQYKLLNDETISWIESQRKDDFDWLLNLWGGYLFSEKLISRAKRSLNIHPSYLPYGRGRDSVVWAIRYKQPAGVTLHQITENIDEGGIYFQEKVNYIFPISGERLYSRVIQTCLKVFNEKWPLIRSEQNFNFLDSSEFINKVYSRKDLLEDNLINLNKDKYARELFLRIMAHDYGDDYNLKILNDNKLFSLRLDIKEVTKEINNE